MFGRDLFAGTETVNTASTTLSTTSGSASLTIKQTAIQPGSAVEGWIVRVISEGVVVRMDASLQELKSFAQAHSSDLDKIAAAPGPVLPDP